MILSTSKPWLGRIACLLILSATCFPLLAGTLTLEAALATVESGHPDIMYAQAERDSAMAERSNVNSRLDTSIYFEGILRSGRPSAGAQDFTSDNSARLTARKTLYDFGRSSNAEAAADFMLNAREADLASALDNRRLEIMSRYFDVLLADLQYTVDNELLAVYYVSFDQGKDRLERGQISSVELAELETRYQDILLKRNNSAQRQRITRAMLANAMNQPNDLPEELEDPELKGNAHQLPEPETLRNIMLENNSRLRAQQEMLAASQRRLESLRAETSPTLDAEIQTADYSRKAALRDNLSAGVILSWPLYQGGKADSKIAYEMAQFNKLQASTDRLKMELTQSLLEITLEITELQNTARQAAQKFTDYRDLQLERSRGLYELELKSNLGTSMVGTSEATLRTRNNEYRLALDFARLEALLGKPLNEIEQTKGKDK